MIADQKVRRARHRAIVRQGNPALSARGENGFRGAHRAREQGADDRVRAAPYRSFCRDCGARRRALGVVRRQDHVVPAAVEQRQHGCVPELPTDFRVRSAQRQEQ